MHEKLAGEASEIAPYLNIIEQPDLPYHWDDELLEHSGDPFFMHEVKQFRKDLDDDWELIEKVIDSYSDTLSPEQYTKDLFLECYDIVGSRIFGFGVKKPCLVPFIDCLNHTATKVSKSEYFNKAYHVSEPLDGPSIYMNKEKTSTNYSQFYTEEDGLDEE